MRYPPRADTQTALWSTVSRCIRVRSPRIVRPTHVHGDLSTCRREHAHQRGQQRVRCLEHRALIDAIGSAFRVLWNGRLPASRLPLAQTTQHGYDLCTPGVPVVRGDLREGPLLTTVET